MSNASSRGFALEVHLAAIDVQRLAGDVCDGEGCPEIVGGPAGGHLCREPEVSDGITSVGQKGRRRVSPRQLGAEGDHGRGFCMKDGVHLTKIVGNLQASQGQYEEVGGLHENALKQV